MARALFVLGLAAVQVATADVSPDSEVAEALQDDACQGGECEAGGASLQLMQRKGALQSQSQERSLSTDNETSDWDIFGFGSTAGRETGQSCFLYSCSRSLGVTECHHFRCICAKHYKWSRLSNRCEGEGTGTLSRDTGGSCRIWWCSRSRGPTDCIKRRCWCKEGWHAENGVCKKGGSTTVAVTPTPGANLLAATGKPPVMQTTCSSPYMQCGGEGYTGPTCCEGFPSGPMFTCMKKPEKGAGYAECTQISESEEFSKYRFADNLRKPSTAPVYTFYVYRVNGKTSYPPENVNAGNLGGIMWYLHNEIVSRQDYGWKRKFDISRIQRIKFKTRAPQPLYDNGMNFGVRYAFDKGQCTGPFSCDEAWQNYGYFVGCNRMGPNEKGFPFPGHPVQYSGIWYSFPGKCPQMRYWEKSNKSAGSKGPDCLENQPGGICDSHYPEPTGTADCTWLYEDAGEISIDEFEGIPEGTYDDWVAKGNREYDRLTDVGTGMTFWDHINDTAANTKRVAHVQAVFEKKYPGSYDDVQEAPCDFDMDKFYQNAPGGFVEKAKVDSCHTAEPGEPCHDSIKWAKSDGIYAHPDWYPGLTSSSSDAAFQLAMHKSGEPTCQKPCGGAAAASAASASASSDCHTAVAGEKCFEEASWAKSDGIYAHPDWYGGLTPQSPLSDFQKKLASGGASSCKMPC